MDANPSMIEMLDDTIMSLVAGFFPRLAAWIVRWKYPVNSCWCWLSLEPGRLTRNLIKIKEHDVGRSPYGQRYSYTVMELIADTNNRGPLMQAIVREAYIPEFSWTSHGLLDEYLIPLKEVDWIAARLGV